MNKQLKFLLVIIILLAGGNIIFGVNYFFTKKELQVAQKSLSTQQFNIKVINFNRLFVQKVLKAETDISMEDRLKLENTVRELKDQEILDQWQKFTGATTEKQAQQEVKNLLDLLGQKISY